MPDTDNPPKSASLWRRLAALLYDSLLLLAIWFIATASLLPLTGGEAIEANNPFLTTYLLRRRMQLVAFSCGIWISLL